MLWMIVALVWQQEYHYVDAVAIYLKSGEVYKTAEEVKEDAVFYSWTEEGLGVFIEKRNVQSFEYFTLRVPGPKPRGAVKTRVQRRISGAPVVYRRDGELYLKRLHVDARGKSMEGRGAPNYVKEIKQAASEQAERHALTAYFSKTNPDYDVVFRFYDKRGRLRAEAFVSGEELPKKLRKNRMHEARLAIPAAMALDELGLVEVMSRRAGE